MDTTREISEWREKYITRLMRVGNLTRAEAETTFAECCPNVTRCPEQEADEELERRRDGEEWGDSLEDGDAASIMAGEGGDVL